MIDPKLAPALLALTAVLACTIDKSGDDDAGATTADSSGTTSGSASTGGVATVEPTSAGPTTDATGPDSATDGETGTGEENLPCVATPTVLALDEPSPGGFSGAQLLADKLGVRMTTLDFASEGFSLTEQWKGKQLPLSVELRHEGGEVRWMDSEPNPDWDDSGNDSGIPFECIDRLEVDVKIDFVTEAKEFDEHHDAVLTATTSDRADLDVQLLPPGVMGSLDPAMLYEPGEPESVVSGISIFGTWQGDKAGGDVMHEVMTGGEEGFVGFGPLAGWGDPIQP